MKKCNQIKVSHEFRIGGQVSIVSCGNNCIFLEKLAGQHQDVIIVDDPAEIPAQGFGVPLIPLTETIGKFFEGKSPGLADLFSPNEIRSGVLKNTKTNNLFIIPEKSDFPDPGL